MVEVSKLLPCPFCGGTKVSVYLIRDGREAACSCGATGKPAFHGPVGIPTAGERAVENWNTRATATLQAERDRYRVLEQAARTYAMGWMMDEADDAEFCGIDQEQHLAAVAVFDALSALSDAPVQS